MYWTDQGNTQGTMVGVYRASMDGSNKMVIADGDDADVSHPTGLAIDYSSKKRGKISNQLIMPNKNKLSVFLETCLKF